MGKRKIGEIYNKPIVEGDINLKTPNEIHKSELSGGGASAGEVKEWYYRVNVQGIYDALGGEDIGVISLIIYPNYVIIPGANTHKKFNSYFYSWKDFTVSRTKEIIAFSCVSNIPMQVETDGKIYLVYGDNFTKLKHSLPTLGGDYELIVNTISPYITEISKEEYEALIEIPNVIIGKD